MRQAKAPAPTRLGRRESTDAFGLELIRRSGSVTCANGPGPWSSDSILGPTCLAEWLFVCAWLDKWDLVESALSSQHPLVRKTAVQLLSECLLERYEAASARLRTDESAPVRRAVAAAEAWTRGRADRTPRAAVGTGGNSLITGAERRARPLRILLVGMSGVGKTAAAALLSERLQVPYLDQDAWIEKELGHPIAQPASSSWRAKLLDESELLLKSEEGVELFTKGSLVFAMGGLFVHSSAWRSALKAAFEYRVLLSAEPESMLKRIISAEPPHRLMDALPDNPRAEDLATIDRYRRPYYLDMATDQIATDQLTLNSVVDEVVTKLSHHA